MHLKKAFDIVSHDGLCKIICKFGCPDSPRTLVRQFHDSLLARVQDDHECSQPFPVINSFKQSCVIVPTLFNLIFSTMLTDVFCDGLYWNWPWGHLSRSSSTFRDCKEKPNHKMILYMTFCSQMTAHLMLGFIMKCRKTYIYISSVDCEDFGFTLSTTKTKVRYQFDPAASYPGPINHRSDVLHIWCMPARAAAP